MAIELLQRVGLSKYEAEAYYVLLLQGPLTGYELGKRSGVPLSKSYEVLERLTRRGLAFVQPGRALATSPTASSASWSRHAPITRRCCVRYRTPWPMHASRRLRRVLGGAGRQNILARARALIDEARDRVAIGLWSG